MTFAAGLLRYFTTAGGDVNVVVVPTSREVVRVPETVARFRGVLGNESWWGMAVVTNGNRAMTRLHPAAELVIHYVTVLAGFSIVSHVGVAASVNKGVGPHTDSNAEQNAENHPACDFSTTHDAFSVAIHCLRGWHSTH